MTYVRMRIRCAGQATASFAAAALDARADQGGGRLLARGGGARGPGARGLRRRRAREQLWLGWRGEWRGERRRLVFRRIVGQAAQGLGGREWEGGGAQELRAYLHLVRRRDAPPREAAAGKLYIYICICIYIYIYIYYPYIYMRLVDGCPDSYRPREV